MRRYWHGAAAPPSEPLGDRVRAESLLKQPVHLSNAGRVHFEVSPELRSDVVAGGNRLAPGVAQGKMPRLSQPPRRPHAQVWALTVITRRGFADGRIRIPEAR
jgi:hypothetical protein